MGKSIDAAAAELRISRKFLKGIEEGNYEGWPARVFASGFIRAYAKYLSVDPEPVLAEYRGDVEKRGGGDPALQVKPEWLEREKQRGSRRTTYAAAAFAVLVVGLLLGWYSTRISSRPAPAPRAVLPQPSAKATADNAAEIPPPAAGENPAVSPVSDNAAARSSSQAPPFQLFLEASEQSWVMYSMDEGDPVDVMLYPGDRISVQARKRIFLKLGNAGGVVGTLNGKRMPPFGQRGQVKELRLGEP